MLCVVKKFCKKKQIFLGTKFRRVLGCLKRIAISFEPVFLSGRGTDVYIYCCQEKKSEQVRSFSSVKSLSLSIDYERPHIMNFSIFL